MFLIQIIELSTSVMFLLLKSMCGKRHQQFLKQKYELLKVDITQCVYEKGF